jgi:DNA helicase-2/ATP-dependent DNA helicase PcrA
LNIIVQEKPAMRPASYLDDLNPAQRSAAEFDAGAVGKRPLLIIAGAGSGKTKTLAHRVAHLILSGADPQRISMLTFTRRAAAEMTRRAERICARSFSAAAAPGGSDRDLIPWSGTFHAIGNRLLRQHADAIGLNPDFTVLDRSDAADLMDLVRDDLKLSRKEKRFPLKSTCLGIYSFVINTQLSIADALERAYPWCAEWETELRQLFRGYIDAKQKQNVLDYDDLLLFWSQMMAEPAIAEAVRAGFDHVLVDEYQDTNALQAAILLGLKPDGAGLTVVGDDSQSIYSFRGATVRNILDFPKHFDPPATVITLEQNYRSTQPILEASNAVIGMAKERFTKDLFSTRRSQQKPILVTAEDEASQVDYVVSQILEHREEGIALQRQAVLFRASHHSAALELELTRRNIPFVKFGGLKFLEAAHVKDLVGILRWAENPRDAVAGFRVLKLLPGIGPGKARQALDHLASAGFDLTALPSWSAPAAAADNWPGLCNLLAALRRSTTAWGGQVGMVRRWYQPHLERIHDDPRARGADLDQLEQIAAGYNSRQRFLAELSLDPPDATGADAEPPHLDEDYLILSTIHSAKGQEWDAVFVINVADGSIPSDMGVGSSEELEEERRLLYVAMTRARDHLHLVHPQRFFRQQQPRRGDGHVYAQLTRFIPDDILDRFERRAHGRPRPEADRTVAAPARIDVAARARAMWG